MGMSGIAFFTSDWVPCHRACWFKCCLINWKSHMLCIDWTDKDSIKHTKSPDIIFTTVAAWISSRQFRLSSETEAPAVWWFVFVSKVLVFVIGLEKKKKNRSLKTSTCSCIYQRRCRDTLRVNRGLLLRFMCLTYRYDETGCQHSRQASSTTVDCSTSERLTRYSDVLETISKD